MELEATESTNAESATTTTEGTSQSGETPAAEGPTPSEQPAKSTDESAEEGQDHPMTKSATSGEASNLSSDTEQQQTNTAVTTSSTSTSSVSSTTPTAPSASATPQTTATPSTEIQNSEAAIAINRIISEEDAKWHTVGIFQGLSTNVSNYVDNKVWTSAGLDITANDLPELADFPRISLEPGAAYRFRLRAINTSGASDWSEVASFKTCLPGFPGAPSAIKISKSAEGAQLTWEPPPSCRATNEIVEYSVYLAVKPGKEKDPKSSLLQRSPAQLAFVRVYIGAANQCVVPHGSLAAAHVDCSNKPAIIFRIAARNAKGYGPATQVRWLQDPQQAAANAAAAAAAAAAKAEQSLNAAANKRFKATGGRVILLPAAANQPEDN